MLKGIDIYEGDNVQDWNAVKNEGIEIVIQKASQGTTHVDKLINYRYPLIKSACLKIGFYHFASYNSQDPKGEAQHFLNSINGLESDTIMWLDLEAEEHWDKQIAINYANTFINYIKNQGHKIGIYTGDSFFHSYLEGNIPDIPLWLASYGREPSLYTNGAASWQYSELGSLDGIIGNVDLDYFLDNILVKDGGIKKVDYLVVVNRGADENSANVLADYLNCPVITNDRKFDYACVKNIIGVGGKKEQYTSYLTKLISGSDRFQTNQAVLDFIKNCDK
ncbi:GH25 family lysozyme [Clostridium sp. JS66]|uniref:GH25 family lysozyme n=1 Tax=Clostridium sp. JS66 TaxID=3064705 RepID=UPI00298E7366|nr:GH25 family lysozyme [Clostridium sp. JS66]WPC40607.1 GH25 family lysozyme [Clostridium sp. JS66]